MASYGHNSAQALHVTIEAKKLAYADMLRYTGDPRFGKLPTDTLNSKDFAAERARLIDEHHANCEPTAGKWPSGRGRATTRFICRRSTRKATSFR